MRYDDPTENAPARSRTAMVVDLVAARWWSIVGTIVAIAGVWIYVGYDVSIPRPVQVGGIAAIALLPWGYVLGGKVKEWIFDPHLVYVVDVDARFIDAALFEFPYNDFMSLEVTEGHIDQVSPGLAFAKNVDPEELRADGTWRGTLNDRELLTALHMIDVCRGRLEEDAKVGFAFRAIGWSIVRSAVVDTTKVVVDSFQDMSMPDRGEKLNEVVDDALDRYDVEEQFRKEAADLGASEDDEDVEDVEDVDRDRRRNGEPEPAEVEPSADS